MTEEIYKQFLADTAEHKVHVSLGDNLRMLDVRRGNSSWSRYFVTTWPWHLAISGDISDGLIFSHPNEYDMFDLFDKKKIGGTDFRYWAQKLTNGAESVKEFSEERFVQYVDEQAAGMKETYGDDKDAVEQINQIVADLKSELYRGPEHLAWEIYNSSFKPVHSYHVNFDSDMETNSWYDYNYRFYLNCYAIQAAIQTYNQSEGEGDVWLHPESLLQAHGITRTKPDSE
jgi:hypothetical protein